MFPNKIKLFLSKYYLATSLLLSLTSFLIQIDPGESVGASKNQLLSIYQSSSYCYWEDSTCDPTTWTGLCATGNLQSPIDLSLTSVNGIGYVLTNNLLNRINSLYGTQSLSFSSFQIENNAHSIEVTLPSGSTPLILTDPFTRRSYTFAQMHFHWGPVNRNKINGSEHTINGVSTVGELHLVHYGSEYASFDAAVAATTDSSSLLVLGILLEASYISNPALTTIVNAVPTVVTALDVVQSVSTNLNIEKLFPTDLDLFRYSGSLTSPTCNEQVAWLVFKDSITISPAQLAIFRQANTHTTGLTLTSNFRLIQPRNSRRIEYYKVLQTNSLIWGWIYFIIRLVQRIFSPLRDTLLFNYKFASMIYNAYFKLS